MGGRGSASVRPSGAVAAVGSISESEYDLLASSPQYGSMMTGTSDKSVYQYGAANGLSRQETDLVHSYTFDLYKGLNDDIRAGNGGITTFAKNKLNAALDKLPGHTGVTFRGISVDNPNAFAASLKGSKSFTFDSFTSTTTSASKAREFTTKGKSVVFEITSKKGKNVAKLSSQKDENEVLFKAGSSFKYVSHREVDGVVYVKIKG